MIHSHYTLKIECTEPESWTSRFLTGNFTTPSRDEVLSSIRSITVLCRQNYVLEEDQEIVVKQCDLLVDLVRRLSRLESITIGNRIPRQFWSPLLYRNLIATLSIHHPKAEINLLDWSNRDWSSEKLPVEPHDIAFAQSPGLRSVHTRVPPISDYTGNFKHDTHFATLRRLLIMAPNIQQVIVEDSIGSTAYAPQNNRYFQHTVELGELWAAQEAQLLAKRGGKVALRELVVPNVLDIGPDIVDFDRLEHFQLWEETSGKIFEDEQFLNLKHLSVRMKAQVGSSQRPLEQSYIEKFLKR